MSYIFNYLDYFVIFHNHRPVFIVGFYSEIVLRNVFIC